jgi:hypothetical protein
MANNAATTTKGILKLNREIEALLESPGGGAFVVGIVGNGREVVVGVLAGLGELLEGTLVVCWDELVPTTQLSALKFLKFGPNQCTSSCCSRCVRCTVTIKNINRARCLPAFRTLHQDRRRDQGTKIAEARSAKTAI